MPSYFLIIFFLVSYFLGSIPFGLIVGRRVKGVDIREHGSRSTGATNVFRVIGKSWGFLVLFLDIMKGVTAVLLPRLWFTEVPFGVSALLGIIAILGHSFSVWISWKGGKGVATSLGVFLALAPGATLTAFAGWVLVFLIFRIISLASLAAALFFPAAVFLLMRGSADFTVLMPLSLFLGAFIFYTHRANIGRILRKEEKRII